MKLFRAEAFRIRNRSELGTPTLCYITGQLCGSEVKKRSITSSMLMPNVRDWDCRVGLYEHFILASTVCCVSLNTWFPVSFLERPGVFDCVREGSFRLLGYGMPQSTRLFPVWHLVLPTAFYGTMHYVITAVTQVYWATDGWHSF